MSLIGAPPLPLPRPAGPDWATAGWTGPRRGALPSESPQLPVDKPLAALSAYFHVCPPKQLASFRQINPVRWSVTVLLPWSVKRGLGHGTPA
jgi:hypothetical protein